MKTPPFAGILKNFMKQFIFSIVMVLGIMTFAGSTPTSADYPQYADQTELMQAYDKGEVEIGDRVILGESEIEIISMTEARMYAKSVGLNVQTFFTQASCSAWEWNDTCGCKRRLCYTGGATPIPYYEYQPCPYC